jgi:hypothetical protein
MTKEESRLHNMHASAHNWALFGPYLSERQWGTIREDYSPDGDAWNYITHDMARSKAYRWGEDGIAGICDDQQRLCFSVALWNGQDPILKERLFGLSNREGNHGEDVKEYYYYLDNTPTHSYMKMLYKYPQQAFPYNQLIEENARRTHQQSEFELIDTGVFDDDRYYDVFVEYAKASPDDVLIQLTICNRGPQDATLHVLPQLWFRNTWSWGHDTDRPRLTVGTQRAIHISHKTLGNRCLFYDQQPDLLFCDNETNTERLYHSYAGDRFFKDGINDYLVHSYERAINPAMQGTKAAMHYTLTIPAGQQQTVRLRLADITCKQPFDAFDRVLTTRQREADAFYQTIQAGIADEDTRRVQRQALAGMLWNKQFYEFNVLHWLNGDPHMPPPPASRQTGRNNAWKQINNRHILSMPDKWEFPWYAAWDLAFHCLTLSMVDTTFAKQQLTLLTETGYMHPDGQLPAYEQNFSSTNPPIHAWATFEVYKLEQAKTGGQGDTVFLEAIFQKLLLNFGWWVNRKDRDGRPIFQCGFLGMDNLSVFDYKAPLPTGGYIDQTDGPSWMAMYALNMMRIALELSQKNPVYERMAVTFFEHFLYIMGAMNNVGGQGISLWDEEDGFYYSLLQTPDNRLTQLKIRSMVGLIPLFAVDVFDDALLAKTPYFVEQVKWFIHNRPDLCASIANWLQPGDQQRHMLSLVDADKLKRILSRMLDDAEFLSPYGVRALSQHYRDNPYTFWVNAKPFTIDYEPGTSTNDLSGGNSNWRGPIWFPVNYLIIDALRRYYRYYGDEFTIEYPTRSGQFVTLATLANSLSERLVGIFRRDEQDRRAVFGAEPRFQHDPNFRDNLWFYEYFHGETGQGLGASHQTGWTGLIANLLSC